MVKTRKFIAIFLAMILLAGVLAGCKTKENKSFQSMSDFAQSKIGVFTGASFDLLAQEYLPEAERAYFPNLTDMVLNLKQEKIDGILLDVAYFAPLTWESNDLTY